MHEIAHFWQFSSHQMYKDPCTWFISNKTAGMLHSGAAERKKKYWGGGECQQYYLSGVPPSVDPERTRKFLV